MSNVAFIYQTKHIEQELWPACKDQVVMIGQKCYVIVTNDGSASGVYEYIRPSQAYKTYNNNGQICWRVPLTDCNKIMELDQITNEGTIKIVKKMQNDWFEGKVKNQKPKKRKSKYYLQ